MRIKVRLISILLIAILIFSFAEVSLVCAQEEFASNYGNYFAEQGYNDDYGGHGYFAKVDSGVMYDIEMSLFC